MSNSLALYTTVYPAAEEFLSAWYTSVCGQTDCGFDLWIGTDEIEPSRVFHAIGREFQAYWVAPLAHSTTPAGVRQTAINAILDSPNKYEGIVFVDCDDMMFPSRVESARTQIENVDVAGCAMEIVNQDGRSQGLVFQLGSSATMPSILTRTNVFGMSNTAYRTEMLRKIPSTDPHCRLMDWFIVTAAWIRGARFEFNNTPLMQYRQYEHNTARVLTPFTEADIRGGTTLVLQHYGLVLSTVSDIPDAIQSELRSALENVQRFQRSVVEVPAICAQYVDRLNDLQTTYLWWEWVAHPSLEELWKT
jgi:hypothetical protein